MTWTKEMQERAEKYSDALSSNESAEVYLALALSEITRLREGLEEITTKAVMNKEEGKQLCDPCEGTGNMSYSRYRKCIACNGKGFLESLPREGG